MFFMYINFKVLKIYEKFDFDSHLRVTDEKLKPLSMMFKIRLSIICKTNYSL